MKHVLNWIIIVSLSFGIGYFAALDIDKNFRHRRIVNEMARINMNVPERYID